MVDPRVTEGYAGDLLTGGRIPEFDRAILSSRREEGLRGVPSQDVGAVVVAGQNVLNGAVGQVEEGDGAIGGGGSKLGAIGGPGKVDGVVVEGGGPVFGQLHGDTRGGIIRLIKRECGGLGEERQLVGRGLCIEILIG